MASFRRRFILLENNIASADFADAGLVRRRAVRVLTYGMNGALKTEKDEAEPGASVLYPPSLPEFISDINLPSIDKKDYDLRKKCREVESADHGRRKKEEERNLACQRIAEDDSLSAMRKAYAVALVTTPDIETARELAKKILEARLAACANLIPAVESHYWWQGALQSSSEVLVIFKTESSCLPGLESAVIENHPYDTPEFVVLSLDNGSSRYLQWIEDSTRPSVQ